MKGKSKISPNPILSGLKNRDFFEKIISIKILLIYERKMKKG